MKEFFKITPHITGRGFIAELSTGMIDVPDQPDCYVISSGCGSGKTESIKSLIRQKHNEGILYCVDTKTELSKMYSWILDNISTLTSNDVIIIDGEHDASLRLYRDNPSLLLQKKVVLITHVRFWTDLINYFVIYNPKLPVGTFDGDFPKLLSRPDLRKYIVFDETPLFVKSFFKMPKALLGVFAEKDSTGNWKVKDPKSLEDVYTVFIKGSSLDPFPDQSYMINRIKKDVVLRMLPKVFMQWMACQNEDVSFRFTPAMLKTPNMNTHILIFEGAGDVLFDGGRNFKVLDIKNKYNSIVSFEEMKFSLRRRDEVLDKAAYRQFIASLSNRLRKNQSANKHTLVVVWKNIGKNPPANSTDFYDMVRYDLAKKGLKKSCYSVIYHGSSQSKSTNEFRDYQEVILCGAWGIPNSDTFKFRSHFGVNTNSNSHSQFQFIQTICRIGIRKHDQKPYSVVYTSDYSKAFIGQLSMYLNSNMVVRSNVEADKIPDWLRSVVDNYHVRKDTVVDLIKLIENYDPTIMDALRENRPMKLSLDLATLHKIVHRSEKKKRNYDRLVRELKILGIELIIN